MKERRYSKFTCLVACLIMAINILLGVPSAQADLLVTDFTSVLRYNQTTGAFLGVLVPSGSGGLDNAQRSAFGPDGNLYVASFESRNILRYDGVTGSFIDVFVSPGSGGLGAPNDVTFGPDSNMYVADAFYGTNSILRYDGRTGAFIDVFAAGGGIQQPQRLTFGPDGNLFVGNATSSDVLRYHGDTGLAYPAAGQTGAIFVPGIQGPFNTHIAFGPDGNLYVGSGASPDILRYDGTTGEFLGTFVPNGVAGVDFLFGPDNNLYVASYFGQSVLRYYGTTGAFIDTFVASGSGGLGRPSGLVFSPEIIINDLVTFDPDPSTYYFTRNTSGCPSGFVGKFGFEAQLANISQSTLAELQIRIAALSNGNLVLTQTGTTIGAGGTFAVPEKDDYADGDLAPSEAVDVPFAICLKSKKSFKFFVDVLGRR